MNIVLTTPIDESTLTTSVELLQRYRRLLEHDLTHARAAGDREIVTSEIRLIDDTIDQINR